MFGHCTANDDDDDNADADADAAVIVEAKQKGELCPARATHTLCLCVHRSTTRCPVLCVRINYVGRIRVVGGKLKNRIRQLQRKKKRNDHQRFTTDTTSRSTEPLRRRTPFSRHAIVTGVRVIWTFDAANLRTSFAPMTTRSITRSFCAYSHDTKMCARWPYVGSGRDFHACHSCHTVRSRFSCAS